MRPNLPLPAAQALHLAPVALGRAPLAPLAAHRLDQPPLLGRPLAGLPALRRLLVELRRLGRAHAPGGRAAHDHLDPGGPGAQLHPVAGPDVAAQLGRLPVHLHAPGFDGLGGNGARLGQPHHPQPVVEPFAGHHMVLPMACSAVGRMVISGTYARGGSETANSTAAAMSSARSICARISGGGGSGRLSRIGVSITPGRIAVKRTSPSTSNPPPWVSAMAPALAAW